MRVFALSLLLLAQTSSSAETNGQPHLEKHGSATQLIVDGRPFLILGAELHNSSSSSLDYMAPLWQKLKAVPLNTVLTPLSWELVEPEEGKFDFALLDGLLRQAREHNLRVVLLWLAAWKNGMSSYAPLWVKSDTRRFPRVVINGNEVEILSTFSKAIIEADSKAFTSVMRHIKEIDSSNHTVLMIQVENEVGILGDARDHSGPANHAFESAVPPELTHHVVANRESLYPELRELWEQNGAKTNGTWEQIFGASPRTDEIFMAWNYARYVHTVAAAGKAAYNLPMYVNTWLAAEDTTPGDYPSGGPQPRVVDIWKAAGKALDIYTPDIYQANFAEWCRRYHGSSNPLFIPETNGAGTGGANAFYAFGEHAAIGFSPFGIDSWNDAENELGKSYHVLEQLTPLLVEHQAKGDIHGFVIDKSHPSVKVVLEGFLVDVSLDEIFASHAEKGFGVLLVSGPNEFLGAGKGFRVSFRPANEDGKAGLASVDEGHFENGKWIRGRRLNGDETDQGKYWRFDQRQITIEKAVVYSYP
ncbi:MAG: DUF5597 domain-containing protein [Bryobacteraceae bacterium]